MIPMPGLIQDFLDPWQSVVAAVKQEVVSELGTCTDISPTFTVVRVGDRTAISASCLEIEQRYTTTELPTLEPATRWMNLCRQVVTLSKADIAMAAVEITADLVNDDSNTVSEIEAIEINLITPELVFTRIMPYRYGIGRQVDWLPVMSPDPNVLNRGAAQEIDACRQAWCTSAAAYQASVRYLSAACQAEWIGDPELLAAVLGHN
jgi:hypothetical protein